VLIAVDPAANTVTIKKGENSKVYSIGPDTRILHEGAEIPLAQFPVNTPVKFSMASDGAHLATLWYGHHLYEAPSLIRRKQAATL
jgi:hypothetical protein